MKAMVFRLLAAGGALACAACTHIQDVGTAPIRHPGPAPGVGGRPAVTAAAKPAPAAAVPAPAPRESRRKGDERPEFYTVARGDTLYGIALDFGFDYKELAAWNELADPSVIRVGQRLRLTPPADLAQQPVVKVMPAKGGGKAEALPGTAAAPAAAEGADAADAMPPVVRTLTEPKAVTLAYSDKAYAQLGGAAAKPLQAESKSDGKPEPKPDAKPAVTVAAAPAPKDASDAKPEPKSEPKPQKDAAPVSAPPAAPARSAEDDDRMDWVWPAKGEVLYRFGESGKLKGVGIGGKSGQPVFAAAPGKVVYSGSGLRGYGKLVIIKHNDMFLSVYAHNSQIVVKEGETVKRGQRIAEMGDTDASRTALHFEIRRYGKPVDPLTRLPGAGAAG